MAKITVYGMEKYLNSLGKSLFSGVTFPEGIDRATAINECIIASNEFEVLYSDGDFFIEAVTQWAKKYQLTWAKWVEGFASEFSPIDNYDRQESWEDHKGYEDKTTYGKTTTDTHEVSAYDSSGYSPKDKTTTGTANSDTVNYKENSSHKGHVHGNIGVMRTTDILQGWIDFYKDNTVYKLIADSFVSEFCIQIY